MVYRAALAQELMALGYEIERPAKMGCLKRLVLPENKSKPFQTQASQNFRGDESRRLLFGSKAAQSGILVPVRPKSRLSARN